MGVLRDRMINSCRNRHCPKCQSLAKLKWLDKQKSELLPVEYFHLVFPQRGTEGQGRGTDGDL